MAQTILIVEDDDLSMKLETDLLHEIGYNVLQSRDGSDALSLARKHDPALIIMDIRLPSVSGIERTMMLKADNALKDNSCAGGDGNRLEGRKKKILEAGCAGYMSKPFSITHFLETVEKLINRQKQELSNVRLYEAFSVKVVLLRIA